MPTEHLVVKQLKCDSNKNIKTIQKYARSVGVVFYMDIIKINFVVNRDQQHLVIHVEPTVVQQRIG